ncbi:SDR family oxidoreductase [Streptomyces abikoensis]
MTEPRTATRTVPKRWRRELSEQVVVVTGAARGIGATLARRLSECGAHVALVGLEDELLATVADACGATATCWPVDVTDRTTLTRIAEKITSHYGRVDTVVANAGIAVHGRLTDIDPDTFDRVVTVNLLGSATTARTFLPALTASRGHFLQITSLAALTPLPLLTAYGASKAGAEAFAHALRAEVAPHNVTVGVAYMSWTDTDLVRAGDQYRPLHELRRWFPRPFSRIHPPEAVAERLVAGLVSRSAHVYGQSWVRGVRTVRAAMPTFSALVGPRLMRHLQPAFTATEGCALLPLGPGGEAATVEHSGSPSSPCSRAGSAQR